MLLRSITQHVKDQNWFAVALDFFIVVVGILIAFQITEWSEQRQQGDLEKVYLHRLASDLDETIDYLSRQDERQTEIRLTIEKAMATLNNSEASDEEVIEAIILYVTKGAEISDFKVTRTTFDDLQSTGNLSLLKNETLVQSLGQLHTNFADHDLDALVNADWVNPVESTITVDMDFLRFDSRVAHLFPEKSTSEIAQHIRENQDLLQRNAAVHYWYVDSISKDYKSAVEEAKAVRAMIQAELEKN